jgi:hypothetical protein
MTFYEICGFVLSIATLVMLFLLSHGFNSSSQSMQIICRIYTCLFMFVFIGGIWKLIFNQ